MNNRKQCGVILIGVYCILNQKHLKDTQNEEKMTQHAPCGTPEMAGIHSQDINSHQMDITQPQTPADLSL